MPALQCRAASTADILKFLIDRTGYIKLLEEEDTPEAYSRVENLRELVNAAMDSRDRGETLDQFLDHAALVSDADAYDERAQITLMTLHAAKGLEFPLVFLGGLEEGLFPHSRTFLQPDDIEEERRLCYVGMTRAMDTLILTRAVYRRRYGTDLPEASIPSRFLEEIPVELVEELGTSRRARQVAWPRATRPRSRLRGRVARGHTTRHTSRNPLTTPTKMKTRARAWTSQQKTHTPRSLFRQVLQLHREHRRLFRLARQEIQRAQIAGRGAQRQKGIPSGAEGAPSQIWRRHGVPARRRR